MNFVTERLTQIATARARLEQNTHSILTGTDLAKSFNLVKNELYLCDSWPPGLARTIWWFINEMVWNVSKCIWGCYLITTIADPLRDGREINETTKKLFKLLTDIILILISTTNINNMIEVKPRRVESSMSWSGKMVEINSVPIARLCHVRVVRATWAWECAIISDQSVLALAKAELLTIYGQQSVMCNWLDNFLCLILRLILSVHTRYYP